MTRIPAAALAVLLFWAVRLPAAGESLAQSLDTYQDSARSAAMGSSFVGLADDSAALLANPAGLATLDSAELALNHDDWLVDTHQDQGLMVLPYGRLGTLGLGADFLDFGLFQSRDALGNPLPSDTASRAGLDAAWGLDLLPGWSLGAGLRGEYDTLAEVHDASLAADVGLLWQPLLGLRLGFAALNFGPSVDGFQEAAALRAGASYRLDFGEGRDWLVTADYSLEPGAVDRLQVGTEARFYGHVEARAGYDLGLADSQLSGLSGLTVGLGLGYASVQVDYAYLPYGDLGSSQRLSVSYRFKNAVRPKEEIPAPKGALKRPGPPAPGVPGGVTPSSGAQYGGPAASTATVQAKNTSAPPGANELRFQFSLPQDPLNSGLELEGEGKSTEALKAYLEAVKEDNQDAHAWRALGNLYFKLGQTALALQCFEQVLALHPGDDALRKWVDDRNRAQNGP